MIILKLSDKFHFQSINPKIVCHCLKKQEQPDPHELNFIILVYIAEMEVL